MKFEEYKVAIDKVLASPDTALVEIAPIETLESTQGEVEALNGRIRDLQDTNIKLFLSQGGKGSDDVDEIVADEEKAVEDFFNSLKKGD